MSFTELAEKILRNAKQLDGWIQANGLPTQSFEHGMSSFLRCILALSKLMKPASLRDAPLDVNAVREEMFDDISIMKDLAQNPDSFLWNAMSIWTLPMVLQYLNEYKVPQAVPLSSTTTYREIAAKTNQDESLLKRHIRYAITMHIFDEDSDGNVKHTSFSRLMTTHPFISDAINFHTKELGAASVKNIDALEKYGPSGEPNEGSYNILTGVTNTLWENTVYAAGAMRFGMAGDAWNVRHILDAFDWKSIDKPGAAAIDLGGGMGQVSAFVSSRTDHLSFVVQDLPHIISEARKSTPDATKSRIEFQEHDFFTPQTLESSPDLIFTRFILHDWSDKYATIILKGLVPIMSVRTKILIFECVLPEGPMRRESRRIMLEQDITMRVVGNGRERSASDFKSLLAGADKRYVLEMVNDPPASMLKGVVIGWNPDS